MVVFLMSPSVCSYGCDAISSLLIAVGGGFVFVLFWSILWRRLDGIVPGEKKVEGIVNGNVENV